MMKSYFYVFECWAWSMNQPLQYVNSMNWMWCFEDGVVGGESEKSFYVCLCCCLIRDIQNKHDKTIEINLPLPKYDRVVPIFVLEIDPTTQHGNFSKHSACNQWTQTCQGILYSHWFLIAYQYPHVLVVFNMYSN